MLVAQRAAFLFYNVFILMMSDAANREIDDIKDIHAESRKLLKNKIRVPISAARAIKQRISRTFSHLERYGFCPICSM